jgi:putative copper export protein
MKRFMQWLHVVSVTTAIGGIVFIIFSLLPSLGAIDQDQAGKLMGAIVSRFRLIVWLCILGITISGIYMSVTQTPLRAWRDLVTTTYGKLLLIKIILGVTIAKISLALTLPFGFLAGIQQHMVGLLKFNLLLAVIVIFIAARLRRP